MPRFWGLHHCITHFNELRSLQGKTSHYPAVPIDNRMRSGDFVFLFWGHDYLNGWGSIVSMGQKSENGTRDVVVIHSVIQPQLANVREEIRNQPIFENYDRLTDGTLSSFNDDQVRYLNNLCKFKTGSCPPDPDELKEDEANAFPLRPVIAEFIKGQRLLIDETRFDEFKTILSGNAVKAILNEVDEYAVAFLNIEDRRDEDFCRVFWGVDDKSKIVSGITLSDKQRDEVRSEVSNKLARIEPRLASSSYYIELHKVEDKTNPSITDLFVVEVGIGHGARQEFYCTENGSFYIRQDGSNRHLKGQLLVEEIRRRLKSTF